MAAAAIAAGADGLILEVHPEPEKALSDGYQSLTFDQFDQTMQLCRRIAAAMGKQIDAEPETQAEEEALAEQLV
jgi:3-deoxy-7-phosphoheptulonate synthase